MASACVNKIGISSESFMDCPPAKYTSYGWLSPKISFNRDDNPFKSVGKDLEAENTTISSSASDEDKESDPVAAAMEFGEFEFQLEGADVKMLPADELFSDGKLVPLQLSMTRPEKEMTTSEDAIGQVITPKIRLGNEVSPNDPYLFSPRAPTCSSRWKELLGLKRFYQNSNNKQHEHQKTTSPNTGHKSLKVFLHRGTKSSVSPQADSSLSLPLIQDTDTESISISSSRLSLSSSCSSSGHEHDDFPRHSLDSEKPNFRRSSNFSHRSRQLQGVLKEKSLLSSENPDSIRTGRSSLRKDPELISADSPRMNSSGKIVFHSLERSSSSPSTLNGGPRYKYKGMERSYSANVRYTPVLNVPVCSLRGSSSSSKSAGVFGFPLFSPSSQQKKDGVGSVVSSAVASGAAIKGLHINRKNRSDRA